MRQQPKNNQNTSRGKYMQSQTTDMCTYNTRSIIFSLANRKKKNNKNTEL